MLLIQLEFFELCEANSCQDCNGLLDQFLALTDAFLCDEPGEEYFNERLASQTICDDFAHVVFHTILEYESCHESNLLILWRR